MTTLLSTLSLSICCLALFGCGQSDEPVAGIEGTGDKINTVVAQGTVTGFGSIYVNGIHFNTDNVAVYIDGEPAQESDLDVGMVVEVVGQLSADGSEGAAHEVNAEHILQGTIESVEDLAAGRKLLVVLGQTVFVNEDASFNGLQFNELMPGTTARISGYSAGNGMIAATHLQASEGPAGRMVVDGYISGLDQARQIITLNDLTINTNAAIFTHGQFAQLKIGMRVNVVGRLNMDAHQLDAEVIKLREVKAPVDNHRAVEGIMQMRGDDGRWMLGDIVIEFGSAKIENGSLDDVLSGSHVIAYGQVKNGVLIAEKLTVKSLNTHRFDGVITAIDTGARAITLLNTTIAITSFTQSKDESPRRDRYFRFDDLRVGEDIELYAVQVNGQWHATRIVRRDFDEQRPHVLRGNAVITEGNTTFYIGNVAVDGSQLNDEDWQLLLSQESPAFIEVQGFISGDGQFVASSIDIQTRTECDPRVFFNCKNEGDKGGPPESDFRRKIGHL